MSNPKKSATQYALLPSDAEVFDSLAELALDMRDPGPAYETIWNNGCEL
jgi:hypothetical protein